MSNDAKAPAVLGRLSAEEQRYAEVLSRSAGVVMKEVDRFEWQDQLTILGTVVARVIKDNVKMGKKQFAFRFFVAQLSRRLSGKPRGQFLS